MKMSEKCHDNNSDNPLTLCRTHGGKKKQLCVIAFGRNVPSFIIKQEQM